MIVRLPHFLAYTALATFLLLLFSCGNRGEEQPSAPTQASEESTNESISSEAIGDSTSDPSSVQGSLVSGLENVVEPDAATESEANSAGAPRIRSSSNAAGGKSVWQGTVEGQVYNQTFRLPIQITFRNPIEGEQNPMNITIETTNPPNQANPPVVGHFGLASALSFATSSGGATATGGATPLALQYFTIQAQGPQISAVLTDTHFSEAAAANLFQGPPVSGQTAPAGPVGRIFETVGQQMGGAELFAFQEGTQLSINIEGNQLAGNVQGTGQSAAAGMATSGNANVPFQAQFSANQVS